jgi:hypothetical protein
MTSASNEQIYACLFMASTADFHPGLVTAAYYTRQVNTINNLRCTLANYRAYLPVDLRPD